jgi:hypothetical protein
MEEDLDARVAEARWRFLVAYRQGKLEELRQNLNETRILHAMQGNMYGVKHGARSRRVIECLHNGSLDEWRYWLRRINQVEDARKARKAASLSCSGCRLRGGQDQAAIELAQKDR